MATIAQEEAMVDVARPRMTEQPTQGVAGLPMLGLGLAASLAGGGLLTRAIPPAASGLAASPIERLFEILLILVSLAALRGLTAVAPGEARVIEVFGQYIGTMRASGLRWVNPFARRKVVSTRLR